MRLDLCTWQEVEAYLKTSTGIIIPIGSMEQHGPVGFIGTDTITSTAVAHAVGEETGAMVGSPICVGMAQHHLGFAGSMTLRPSTLIAVIRDMVVSLAKHGFERFMFVNGHGGNIATATAAFDEIYAEASLGVAPEERPAIRCDIVNWWQGKAILDFSKQTFGDAEGWHATASEVALTYHLYPEDAKRVQQDSLTPRVAPKGGFYDADNFRDRYPDGRIGSDPTLATPELGEKIMAISVNEISAKYRDFISEA